MAEDNRLTVIGAGLMGSAFAREAVRKGLPVSIWARNSSRVEDLRREGVEFDPSISAAFARGGVVVLLLSDYAAATRLLLENKIELNGCVVVNLMTGTQAEAREFGQFVRSGGGLYLDGVLFAYPAEVLKGTASIRLAGDGEAWVRALPVLNRLTSEATYLGENESLPNALDAVLAGAFHVVVLGAFFEAAAFANACGVPLPVVGEAAQSSTEGLKHVIADAVERIQSASFETDQATLSVYLAAARKWRAQMIEAGQRANLATANLHNLEIAEAAGYGSKSIVAQYLTAGAKISAEAK